MMPYTPEAITTLLRAMPADQLAVVQPEKFLMWPVKHITKHAVIAELIANERASRRTRHGQ